MTSTRRLRVAMVSHSALPSGAELGTARLVRSLGPEVDPVFVFFQQGPLVDTLTAEGFEVVVVPLAASVHATGRHDALSLRSLRRQVAAVPSFQRRLRAELKRLDLDLVHSHSLKSHVLVSAAVKSLHLPLVWHFHDRIAEDYLPRVWVTALRGAARSVPDAVVANSDATASTLPGSPVSVIPPALEPSALRPAPHRPDAAAPIVGMLGRLSDTKGQHVLLAAAPQILQRFPAARLRIVGAPMFGQDAYAAGLREQVERLGLGEHVEFVGHVEDPYAEMDTWSVFVHASPVPEPFGQVITEAMARRVPVVATEGGGVADIVRPSPHEAYGELVPAGDPAALADAVVTLLADPTRADHRAQRAYRYAAERYDIGESARRTTALWSRLIPGRAPRPRLALAHDYLTQRGGAERVVLAMCDLFPEAGLKTLMYEPAATFAAFAEVDVETSWLNGVGWLRRHYRAAMPILALAASTSSVSGDVVLVSSSGWAHGMRVNGRKVVYCHSPARWLYKTREYLGENWWLTPKGAALAALRPGLRRWDRRAARTADTYIVNSSAVAQVVRATYGIEPLIIHPPVTLDPAGLQEPIGGVDPGFALVVCRLLPYKNVDMVVRAFAERGDRLLVIGAGPLKQQIEANLPDNVTLRSDVPEAQLRWAYANARCLVAASFEDFGLTPVEAAQFGTPTVALRSGGYLDTVQDGINGIFFEAPEVPALLDGLARFDSLSWDRDKIVHSAQAFTPEQFARQLGRVLGPDLVAHLPGPLTMEA
ncbi:glycosyltransferase involved in cell wall biosynthesis [Branchiibius hedensis]|uniref:D-inositol 3-phosphate glycosyltransferase n=1 Tax=Branchiibius hedensis TaxID=672460 RepID=A0A2Y9BU11_9MICO|nr:glycosyltransferase [Branchiibius hedensis]PWJ26140.1 glycosyltransferase involved in cell wall biosynthesis [Branchiibius hedensis]SSA34952.1 Glycosyltransferase involved in cell wall bisynthesis [Branchiibius hedensis]